MQISTNSSLTPPDAVKNIKKWTYSTEYLAGRVNSQLGDHYEERLGHLAARLSNDVGISSSDISIEGNRLAFPDGMYRIEYEAADKKRGRLMHRVSFLKSWFGRPDDIVSVLNALELAPTEIHFELAASQEPLDLIPGLEANGWVVTSQLRRKVEARRDTYRVLVEDSTLSFKGFSPSELLGGDASSNEGQLASGVMALLSSARPLSPTRPFRRLI